MRPEARRAQTQLALRDDRQQRPQRRAGGAGTPAHPAAPARFRWWRAKRSALSMPPHSRSVGSRAGRAVAVSAPTAAAPARRPRPARTPSRCRPKEHPAGRQAERTRAVVRNAHGGGLRQSGPRHHRRWPSSVLEDSSVVQQLAQKVSSSSVGCSRPACQHQFSARPASRRRACTASASTMRAALVGGVCQHASRQRQQQNMWAEHRGLHQRG